MRKIRQNQESFNCFKSRLLPGSYKKAEMVLRRVRSLAKVEDGKGKINLSEALIASLQFSNSRRASFLAKFLSYILKSHAKSLSQIYIEKGPIRKKIRFKSKSAILRKSHKFRYVALIKEDA